MKTQNQYNQEIENNPSNLETKIVYLSDKIKPGHLKRLILLYFTPVGIGLTVGTVSLLEGNKGLTFLSYAITAIVISDAVKNSTRYKATTLYGLIKRWGNTIYKKEII